MQTHPGSQVRAPDPAAHPLAHACAHAGRGRGRSAGGESGDLDSSSLCWSLSPPASMASGLGPMAV